MKKTIIIICITILLGGGLFFLLYKKGGIEEKVEENKKEHAIVEIEYVDSLDFPFLGEVKVSDLITSMNGKLVDDYTIDTTVVGEKEVSYEYINDDGIKLEQKVKINVLDITPPIIWCYANYYVEKGNDFHYENIFCGDDYDSDIKCSIEGEYDTNTVGVYPLTIKGVDDSGNTTTDNFNLNVIEPKPSSGGSTSTPIDVKPKTTDIDYFIKNYKTDKTKIGIDVSEFQHEIDFDLLKDSGVEFIIVRVGGSKGTDKDYFEDKYFEYNVTKANELGIDVGIYYFSYADSIDHARRDANWVVEQLKDYKIDLPVAFDWENWQYFNSYEVSFYELTMMANEFIKILNDAGYEGMLYSSTSYLTHIWMPNKHTKWVAEYNSKLSYAGEFTYWQLSDKGAVSGIDGPVDIDIMYID